MTRLLEGMGIAVNAVAPMGASPADIARLGAAHFNVLLYPETGESAARWAEKTLKQPYTKTVPIGVGATRDFVAEVAALAGVAPVADDSRLRQPGGRPRSIPPTSPASACSCSATQPM